MAPTAAVAWVPKVPTMAVSIYCTAVCISSSSMVGHARVKIRASMFLSNLLFIVLSFLGVVPESVLYTEGTGSVKVQKTTRALLGLGSSV